MRHAIVTAGTKGLGKKMTETLLKKGYSVTATYRSDRNKAEALLEEFNVEHDRLHVIQLDTMDVSSINNAVDQAYEQFGRVDCLISNAGPYIFERKKLFDYTEHEWNEMVRGNLDASFYLLKRCLPIMRKQQYGRIVFLGFQGVDHSSGWIYRSAFASAKVGLASLMKTVALEEAENRITANMVAPGKIVDEMKEADIVNAREITETETPIGRPGTGEDIARVVSHLSDEDSDMITGTVVEVTGGLDVIHRHL
ncbi:3-oxoacyl-[acyl-carrier protein] reductase [Alkalibacillus filiformis]|uniref:3-oxoacyl-[acyl-carrier protein] reductase n=1 Tax=Alkalibacillus filiformis TaxID=200990 RepID=A0ABU0DS36_9BACI|nr:SDR family oxidoreductase [Alkalibacillus filiformis]MDQ0351257.1 3-oxoacyl-[acyl-carrier protein] reductase [Alkalibacillus filiformis]